MALDTDNVLIRIKDICLLTIALGAIASWIVGVTQIPTRIEGNEARIEYNLNKIEKLTEYVLQNEIFVRGLSKDMDSIKSELHEIKTILKKSNQIERPI
jgi:hypothetical protein